MKQRTHNLNMTEGEIWKVILMFFLPMMAGNLIQQLYATVDAIIVGRFVGKTGLAAIDSIMAMLRLPGNVFAGLGGGSTIIISQYFGANHREELDKAVHTSILFSLTGGGGVHLRVRGDGILPAVAPLHVDGLGVSGQGDGDRRTVIRDKGDDFVLLYHHVPPLALEGYGIPIPADGEEFPRSKLI